MGRLLKAVDLRIANIQVMAAGTLINYHDLIRYMMAGRTGICLLVFTVREISRFTCLFGLQDNISRTYLHLHCENAGTDTESSKTRN